MIMDYILCAIGSFSLGLIVGVVIEHREAMRWARWFNEEMVRVIAQVRDERKVRAAAEEVTR